MSSSHVSVTKGFVLEEWRKDQELSPNKQLSRTAFCRKILSTLDLVDGYDKTKDWGRVVPLASSRLDTLLKQHKNAQKSGKRKQVDLSEVKTACQTWLIMAMPITCSSV